MIQNGKTIDILFTPWGDTIIKLHTYVSTYFGYEDIHEDWLDIKQELTNNYTTDMGGIFHIEMEE